MGRNAEPARGFGALAVRVGRCGLERTLLAHARPGLRGEGPCGRSRSREQRRCGAHSTPLASARSGFRTGIGRRSLRVRRDPPPGALNGLDGIGLAGRPAGVRRPDEQAAGGGRAGWGCWSPAGGQQGRPSSAGSAEGRCGADVGGMGGPSTSSGQRGRESRRGRRTRRHWEHPGGNRRTGRGHSRWPRLGTGGRCARSGAVEARPKAPRACLRPAARAGGAAGCSCRQPR